MENTLRRPRTTQLLGIRQNTLSGGLQMSLKKAIDEKVKTQYLERFENFKNAHEDQLGENQKALEANKEVLNLVEKVSEEDRTPLLKESIEGFHQIIKMTEQRIDTINLKLAAATRLEKAIKENKPMTVVEFLTDFDIVAGGSNQR
jgi:hypothetical protein